jgi:hypothetical protein
VIISRITRWAEHAARMGERRGLAGFWWGNLRGKKPLGRTQRRWKDDIKMELQGLGCGRMDWIDLV